MRDFLPVRRGGADLSLPRLATSSPAAYREVLVREFHHHFGAGAGALQGQEHFGDLIDVDYVGDHRGGIDGAVGERVYRLLEFAAGVCECEIDLHFFHHAAHRINDVGFHAYADHDDLPVPPDHPDRGAERGFDADTFEYHLGRAAGDRFHRIGVT